jgi:hypothetical protein
MIVQHGHVPTYYFKIDVIPIMKDSKKGYGIVDNYRPVTITSVISKLFEMCLQKMINGCLTVGGLQFGFIEGGGCDKCIFTVQNVENYYMKRKSNVFIVTLDASSAFDRVSVYAFLPKLIDRNGRFGTGWCT